MLVTLLEVAGLFALPTLTTYLGGINSHLPLLFSPVACRPVSVLLYRAPLSLAGSSAPVKPDCSEYEVKMNSYLSISVYCNAFASSSFFFFFHTAFESL